VRLVDVSPRSFSGSSYVYAKGGTNIQHACDYTDSHTMTAMQYAVQIRAHSSRCATRLWGSFCPATNFLHLASNRQKEPLPAPSDLNEARRGLRRFAMRYAGLLVALLLIVPTIASARDWQNDQMKQQTIQGCLTITTQLLAQREQWHRTHADRRLQGIERSCWTICAVSWETG